MNAVSGTDGLEALSAILHRSSMLIEDGLAARFSGWQSSGGAWQDFVQGLKAAGYSPALLVLGIVAMCLMAIAATALLASATIGRLKARPLLSALAWCAGTLLVVLASWILLLSVVSDPVLRQALLNCVVISVAGTTICVPLTTGRRSIFRSWRRDLAVAIGIASGGLAILGCLRIWNAADPLRDFFATFGVSLPFTVLVSAAYLRHRRPVAKVLSFGSKPGSFRRKLASIWPWIAVAIVTCAFVFVQLDLTIGRPTRGGLLLISLLLALAGPHLDVAIERRGWQAARSRGGELTGALWRTFRIVVASLIFAVLAILWLLPVLDVVGVPRGAVLLKAAEILMLVLVIAFCWSWVAILAARLRPHAQGDRHVTTPMLGTRLTTVGPLLVGLTKAALLTMGSLTVLIMLGINVWPLITGLSIFGLAIGLGSQTLVKDVVAGLFFLVDAFRHGEYIETSWAKGTVERISLRSVSLRHPRGPVATIPFGQIGKILNFSREWVVEKMMFRVALDTDV